MARQASFQNSAREAKKFLRNNLMTNSEDLLEKSARLGIASRPVLELLRVFTRLQTQPQAHHACPDAVEAKTLLARLGVAERMDILERIQKRTLPYSKKPKNLLISLVWQSFMEDDSLWIGEQRTGAMQVGPAQKLLQTAAHGGIVQGMSSEICEPMLDTCLAASTHEMSSILVELVYQSANTCLHLTPAFIAKLRVMEAQMTLVSVKRMPAPSFSQLVALLSRSVAIHPFPSQELVNGVLEVMPAAVAGWELTENAYWLAESLRFPVLWRVRHTPSLLAMVQLVLRRYQTNVQLLSVVMLNLAMFSIRDQGLEEAAVRYVRGRTDMQLLLDPQFVVHLSWAFLAMCGRVPDELVGCTVKACASFVRFNYLPLSCYDFVEQLVGHLPAMDAEMVASMHTLLARVAPAQHAKSSAIGPPLGTDAALARTGVRIGAYFVNAVALVDPLRRCLVAWPEGEVQPEELAPEELRRLPGTPVALLVLPESSIRCYRRNLLMGLAARKRRQLEALGWTVAYVGHADLSLQNDFYPVGSTSRREIDDVAVCLEAVIAAAVERRSSAAVSTGAAAADDSRYGDVDWWSGEHDDLRLNEENDLPAFEQYDKGFLDTLFAQQQRQEQQCDLQASSSSAQRKSVTG